MRTHPTPTPDDASSSPGEAQALHPAGPHFPLLLRITIDRGNPSGV
ncbi:MAG TPA: hypothetical protein VMV31_13905 [Terriglobales bacterium]|nr:hypothetical protein [Terriglobales bacterium]